MTPVNPSSTRLQIQVIIQVAKQTNPNLGAVGRSRTRNLCRVAGLTRWLKGWIGPPMEFACHDASRLRSWPSFTKTLKEAHLRRGSSSSSSSTSTSVNYEVVCDRSAYFPQLLGPLTRLRRQWPGHIKITKLLINHHTSASSANQLIQLGTNVLLRTCFHCRILKNADPWTAVFLCGSISYRSEGVQHNSNLLGTNISPKVNPLTDIVQWASPALMASKLGRAKSSSSDQLIDSSVNQPIKRWI